jgi:hypothetical protein
MYHQLLFLFNCSDNQNLCIGDQATKTTYNDGKLGVYDRVLTLHDQMEFYSR